MSLSDDPLALWKTTIDSPSRDIYTWLVRSIILIDFLRIIII